jgi:hypothetical protein
MQPCTTVDISDVQTLHHVGELTHAALYHVGELRYAPLHHVGELNHAALYHVGELRYAAMHHMGDLRYAAFAMLESSDMQPCTGRKVHSGRLQDSTKVGGGGGGYTAHCNSRAAL